MDPGLPPPNPVSRLGRARATGGLAATGGP